jgi:uncharacterized OsmC-like protein
VKNYKNFCFIARGHEVMSGNVLTVDLDWQLEGKRLKASARGNELVVDRIYEDGREGQGFRPTELILSGLGA